jgi:predicted permease
MIFPAIVVHKTFGKDESSGLLKSGFSFFNVAFFGIPVISALFGDEGLTTLICIYIGVALYGNTIGYFQVARTRFGRKDAVKQLFKVPFMYVFVFALILKIAGFHTPEVLKPTISIFGVIVSVAGMMIIGINIEKVEIRALKWKYFLKLLSFRVVSAVSLMSFLLSLQYVFLDGLDNKELKILILMSFFPIAANLTVFASFLKSNEKQSALLVLLSMVLALVLVPLVSVFF